LSILRSKASFFQALNPPIYKPNPPRQRTKDLFGVGHDNSRSNPSFSATVTFSAKYGYEKRVSEILLNGYR